MITSATKSIVLSKSRFIIGLACPRWLWCVFNKPESIPEMDESTQALLDQGKEVGLLAQKRYPKGIEIPLGKDAIKLTQDALKKRVPTFEASFAHKHAYCKVDVLVPVGKSDWDIVEVKSSTEVKDEHVWDVAFQKYCLESAGLEIRRCHLLHINNEYVKKDAIDPEKLFAQEDITDKVSELLPQIGELLKRMVEVIKSPKIPAPELGTECIDPDECPVCLTEVPENSVTELYWIGKKAYPLLNEGITRINELPPTFKLNDKQRVQVKAILSQKVVADAAAVKKFLKELEYPLYCLDFETVNPAIPLFDGTRPYQHIPFQLSIHILKKSGAKPEHVEFLADDASDPRKHIVNALRAISAKGTVLAYNMSFEKRVIEDLQDAFPKEKWLHSLIGRMNDLILPFRNFWYYHPKQRGSCSIKAVLPALTGRSYAHLEVSKGDEAARKFLAMTYKGKKMDKEAVRKALLEYCKQDTEGMIEILNVLETV